VTGQPGYAGRARYYAGEISHVPAPVLLAGLLRPGLTLAEMPSGTGHFLSAYSAASADVTLVDACPQMLAVAQAQATRRGAAIATICGIIEDLASRAGPFELIVMPNGALNQLTARTPLAGLLAAVGRLLAPGGLILAQILAPDAAGGFYDPRLPDGNWRQDRQFTSENGLPVTRRRRQHHRGDVVAIDFELSCGGELVHRQCVTSRLLATADIQAALTRTSLRAVTATPGSAGLAEFLCTRPHRRPR
jgi:SAM-dependent methyltransferase